MAAEREKFIARSKSQGVKAGEAGKVFDQMEYFAGYGFNKSHSAAYALISYQTAYLKAHFPEEFMAAVLTCEKDRTESLTKFIAEARTMGIKVLRPDVNESATDFAVVRLNANGTLDATFHPTSDNTNASWPRACSFSSATAAGFNR
jgi:DNA polymerase-3 subunit alpha